MPAKKTAAPVVEAEITAQFVIERETKMTKRYQEEADDGVIQIGTIYVQRSALARIGNPDAIEVIIRPLDTEE